MSERRGWQKALWLASALAALWLGALAVAQEGAPPPPPEGAEAGPPPGEPGDMAPEGGPGAPAAEGQPGAQDAPAKDAKAERENAAVKTGKTAAAPAPREAGGAPPAPPAAGAADASSSAPAKAEGAEGSGASWDRYKVIAERNVFLRDRTRRNDRMRLPASTAPERQPWQDIVLSGVSRVGHEHVAFLEDTRRGGTTRARVGDEVGGGKIVEMTLDGLTHERNGERARVRVGSTLGGEPPPAARPAAGGQPVAGQPAAPAGPAAAASSEAGPAGSQSVLERLRQRRLQEMNQK